MPDTPYLELHGVPKMDALGLDPDSVVACLPTITGCHAARLNNSRTEFGYFAAGRLEFYCGDIGGLSEVWFYDATGRPAFRVGGFTRRPADPALGRS